MFNRITYTDIYNNFEGSGTPTVSDDETVGYEEGSFYYDSVGGDLYVCVKATSGAAVWENINASGGGSGVEHYLGFPYEESFAISSSGYGALSSTGTNGAAFSFLSESGKCGIRRMRTFSTGASRASYRNNSGYSAYILDDNITEIKFYIKPPDEVLLASDSYECMLGFATNRNPHSGIGTSHKHICWRFNFDVYGNNFWHALVSSPLGSISVPTAISAQPLGNEPWSVFSVLTYGGDSFAGNKRIEFWYEDEAGTALFKAAEITETDLIAAGITDIFNGSQSFGFTISVSTASTSTFARTIDFDGIFLDKRYP